MSKKIGVITFHSAHNYGAFLQTYALQQFLKKRGYDSEVINYRNRIIDNSFKLYHINKPGLNGAIYSIVRDTLFLRKNIKRYKTFEKSIKKCFKLTRKYNSNEELIKNPPEEDIYITGSDQVWSYYLLSDLEDSYTLNFGRKDSIKRISYAASAGDSEVILEHRQKFCDKLKGIDFISVREVETQKILNEILDKKVELVLDPTLLLEKKEWENEIKDKVEKEKYILVYTIGMHEENAKVANYLARKTGYKIIHFERTNRFENTLKSEYGADPFTFIRLIKNAEYVVTTSFHATVFSIIFNKKFWVIEPPKASNRIKTLLDIVNLENRMISTLDELKTKDFNEEIIYDEKKMNNLQKEQELSSKWLINAIEGE